VLLSLLPRSGDVIGPAALFYLRVFVLAADPPVVEEVSPDEIDPAPR
jgi:hypothetical protein